MQWITFIFVFFFCYQQIVWATPEFYTTLATGGPFVFKQNGILQGTAIHKMILALKALHVANPMQHIHLVEPERALSYITHQKNTFLFPIIKTPINNMKISNDIFQVQEVIVGSMNHLLTSNQLENYTYGLTRDNIAGIFLQQYGVPVQKIYIFSSEYEIIQAYKNHRVDLLPGLDAHLKWLLKQEHIPYHAVFFLTHPFGLSVITNSNTMPVVWNTVIQSFKSIS